MALNYCEPCCSINQNNPAKFLCLECQEVYCDKCKTDHSKFRVLRRHQITKIRRNNDLDGSYDHKTENIYVAARGFLKKSDFGTKFDRSGTLTRCLSCGDLGMSSDEYVYSDTRAQHHDYEYIEIDDVTPTTVQNVDSLNEAGGYIYESSDQFEKDPVVIGGLGGKVKKTGNPIKTEERVLHEYSVDVEETDLAKLIGIKNKKCSFRIYSDKIALLADSNVYFEALFTTIRAYGNKQRQFCIEFGRLCEYGQGQLYMKYPKPKNIHEALKSVLYKK